MKSLFSRLARMKSEKGYTLAELSISTSIIAMLAVGGLAILQKKNDSDKVKETITKMVKIETALKGFIRVNGYIPCPSVSATTESSTNFGNSSGIYDETAKICSTGLTNETGVVPVRTLGLPDDTAYDGWGRKFTYRSASASGSATDFSDINFKGNIAIVDLKGIHKTNINEPQPNNDGAIYIIISHGANGKNVAYGKNSTTTPSQASGVEAKNTSHDRAMYIQNEKTTIFDDVVVFGTKAKLGRLRVTESPIKISDMTCETAQSLTKDGRSTLDTYAASNSNAYVSRADTIFKSASILANLCKNRQKAETVNPSRFNNLKLWLDGSDKSTLFTSSDCLSGGSPANGSSIGCWKDKSTNSNNATQTTVASQPTLVTSAQNSKPVLRFDGADDYLALPDNIIADGDIPYTVFAVTKALDINSNPGILNLANLGASSQALAFRFDKTGLVYNYWWDVDISTPIGGTLATTPYILSFSYDTTTGRTIYMNGTSSATESSIGRNGVNSGLGYVGRTCCDSEFMNGDIDEIIVYDSTLNNLSRNKVEEYLSDKWGIVLTSSAQTCSTGMVFQKTIDDPAGSCRCPTGTTYLEDLTTANACYSNRTSTSLGNCVAVTAPPTYSTPPDKSGMVLWLDANDCSTISLVSGGSTSPVSAWTDKSGQSNNASPAAEINRPLYISNAINTKPAIRFDGINSQLAVPRVVNDDFTITAVFKTSAGLVHATPRWYNASGIVDAEVFGTTNDFGMGIQYSGRLLVGTGNPDNCACSDGKYNDGNPHIATFNRKKSTGNISLHVDGRIAATDTGATQSLTAPSRITLGSLQSNINYLNGDIAEVIMYDYVASNQQLDDLESYLSTKWDIPRTPSDVAQSNLKLWLDGSDTTTVYTDNTCTTFTASAWDKVGCWKDKSGNNNNAVQTIDNLKPHYALAIQNTKPVLMFDGTNDFLNNTNLTASQSTTLSIFAVASAGSNTGSKVIINNDFNFYFGVGSTTNYFNSYYGDSDSWGTTADHGSGATPNMSTSFHIISSIQNGTIDSSFIDSTALTTRANTMSTFSNGYTIGSRQTTNSQYWDGNIAEIIIYNTDLSTAQRSYIERYLANKWNITRP